MAKPFHTVSGSVLPRFGLASFGTAWPGVAQKVNGKSNLLNEGRFVAHDKKHFLRKSSKFMGVFVSSLTVAVSEKNCLWSQTFSQTFK